MPIIMSCLKLNASSTSNPHTAAGRALAESDRFQDAFYGVCARAPDLPSAVTRSRFGFGPWLSEDVELQIAFWGPSVAHLSGAPVAGGGKDVPAQARPARRWAAESFFAQRRLVERSEPLI